MLLFVIIVWNCALIMERRCQNLPRKAVVFLFASVIMLPNIELLHLSNKKTTTKENSLKLFGLERLGCHIMSL